MSQAAVSKWARELERAIRAEAKPDTAPGRADYAGTDLEFLNVPATPTRRLAREYDGLMPGPWQECVSALWARPVFDVRRCAIEMAIRHQREFVKSDWKLFEAWLKESVGWAMVDHISCDLFSPLLIKFPESAARTDKWARSKNLWLRRASLAAFCIPVRTGHHLDVAFAHLEALADDHDPMIWKAVSWLLRSCIRTDRRRVEMFLRTHEDSLAKPVRREVRNKLRTGRKNP